MLRMRPRGEQTLWMKRQDQQGTRLARRYWSLRVASPSVLLGRLLCTPQVGQVSGVVGGVMKKIGDNPAVQAGAEATMKAAQVGFGSNPVSGFKD